MIYEPRTGLWLNGRTEKATIYRWMMDILIVLIIYGQTLKTGIWLYLPDFIDSYMLFSILRTTMIRFVVIEQWIQVIFPVFIVGTTYLIFDVEIDALPLVTMGTADLLDIPAGLIGVIAGAFLIRMQCAGRRTAMNAIHRFVKEVA